MVLTYALKSLEQAVEIGTTLSQSWFRGHARVHGDLTPRIFRAQYNHEIYRTFRPDAEFSIIDSFKRQAPALATHLPNDDDAAGWLFLMQHHGTPTRLLDWSESVLVALYFAVEKHPESDAEIWAMYPAALNSVTGFSGFPSSRNPTLQYLVREPETANPDRLAKDVGLNEVPQYPLALRPTLAFPRMLMQMSVFTIHPSPKEGSTIPELLTDPKYLVRYTVGASRKRKLKRDLEALGFHPRTLFPDLDSLSKSIVQEHNVVAYGPPEPPHWDQDQQRRGVAEREADSDSETGTQL